MIKISRANLEKRSKAFLSVFRFANMNLHGVTIDIFVSKMTDFTDAKARRIHDSNHSLLLNIRNGTNEFKCFFLGRNKRKIFIKLTFRELIVVPRFVQNINGKETKLRDGTVNSSVRKITFFLQPLDIISKILP